MHPRANYTIHGTGSGTTGTPGGNLQLAGGKANVPADTGGDIVFQTAPGAPTGDGTALSTVLTVSHNGSVVTTGKLNVPAAPSGNAIAGSATLGAGNTVIVNTTSVTASSIIMLSYNTLGGTPGILSVGTITAGTSFVINSNSSGTDTSTVNWWLVN